MKLTHRWSHGRAEEIVQDEGVAGLCNELQTVLETTRVELTSRKTGSELRATQERILKSLAFRGWETNVRIFPLTAPSIFHRGQYRLDATQKAPNGRTLGLVCHFGSSEFLVRTPMLISEAVRRRIVECGIVALMARVVMPYVCGRIACYEQIQRLLLAYGTSGFVDVPMMVWGMVPEVMGIGNADDHTAIQSVAR